MPGVATTSTAALDHQNLKYYSIGSRKNFGGDRGDHLVLILDENGNCLPQESSCRTGSVPSDLRRCVTTLELKFGDYGTNWDGIELNRSLIVDGMTQKIVDLSILSGSDSRQ